MSSQVCVISIYVPNVNKALDFYTNVLGFQVNKQYSPKIVTLVNGEVPIVLEENEDSSENQKSNSPGVVLALRTENMNETISFLKQKEVDFVIEEPTDCPPGKYIRIRDPFGNVLEYIQFENM